MKKFYNCNNLLSKNTKKKMSKCLHKILYYKQKINCGN